MHTFIDVVYLCVLIRLSASQSALVRTCPGLSAIVCLLSLLKGPYKLIENFIWQCLGLTLLPNFVKNHTIGNYSFTSDETNKTKFIFDQLFYKVVSFR